MGRFGLATAWISVEQYQCGAIQNKSLAKCGWKVDYIDIPERACSEWCEAGFAWVHLSKCSIFE